MVLTSKLATSNLTAFFFYSKHSPICFGSQEAQTYKLSSVLIRNQLECKGIERLKTKDEKYTVKQKKADAAILFFTLVYIARGKNYY